MATVLGLLAFPALFVSAIMMTLDALLGTKLLHAGGFFDGATNGVQRRQPAVCSSTCFWFFGHPEVYIVRAAGHSALCPICSARMRGGIYSAIA